MELCGDLIDRVHDFLNTQQLSSNTGEAGATTEEIVEIAADQERSKSSMASNSSSVGARSNGPNALETNR